MKKISVLAPATVANVVCGFDCLGFALEQPYDEMTITLLDESKISVVHTDDFGLPTEPQKNIAAIALSALMKQTDEKIGFKVEIRKGIMPGSGIGSSSASAVGAVVAANRLLENRFSIEELTEFALAGEYEASRSRHADNVAPCLYGGFTLVRSVMPTDIVSLDFPNLFATVLHPQIEIKTSEARAILPKEIPLRDGIQAWANVGALVAGLALGDYKLIARSLEDSIIEPVRKSLIPGFDDVKRASMGAGALGGGISGSGPSIFMLSETQAVAEEVESAMKSAYESKGIEFLTHVSAINSEGVICL